MVIFDIFSSSYTFISGVKISKDPIVCVLTYYHVSRVSFVCEYPSKKRNNLCHLMRNFLLTPHQIGS